MHARWSPNPVKDLMPAVLGLLDRRDPMVALHGLCDLAVEELPIVGSAVTVVLAGEPLGVLASSGRGVLDLERGRTGLPGPAADAHESGTTVEVVDADADAASVSWACYGDDARRAGVRSVVALPLRVGRAALGALVLGDDQPGVLSGERRGAADVYADVAALLVLAVQAGAYGDASGSELRDLTDQRAVVHQAAGMIAVQLDIDVAAAHLALRARAWQLDQPAELVARDVVSRRLRFTDDV